MIEILKYILFILLYTICGFVVCYIHKAIIVLNTNNSNKWKWDDIDDPMIIMFFPFFIIFYIISIFIKNTIVFIKNITVIPIITITEIIRAKRNMRDKNADSD